jgi:glucose/arabinose dehydrogenase
MLAGRGGVMRRLLIAAGIAAATIAGAGALWPERLAVNAPILQSALGLGATPPAERTWRERLRVPEGFSVDVFADGVKNARMLRFTPAGDLLVSRPRAGRVVLLERDADGDGRSDGARDLVTGLNRPHGIDLHGEWLYVAETDAVGRIRFDAASRSVSGELERVITGLPGGGNHWTRTIRFGADGWLYVSVGSSCNACSEDDPRRAALLRFRPDGSQPEVYATGLRNTVGFDWRPDTGELFGTDNGRDLLGDDVPPCELNRIERGASYGWPFAYGSRVPDPEFGVAHPDEVQASVGPAHAFGAHTAPLGITFLRGAHWPPAYRGAALVALHGSWNRTEKQGYEVVSLHWGGRGTITERPFLSGFEIDEDVIGRPVDVAEGPDGRVYVSDDYTGRIYRVSWGAGSGAGPAAEGAPTAVDPLAAIPAEEREARVARGAALYERYFCAQCHEGLRAREGVIVVPLQGLSARYAVDDLVAFLKAPTPPMPALELGEDERRDLAVYLLAAHP